jgi:hypothetical protein
MSHRVAFYPCCGGDIVEPLELLKPHVDEVIFCDLKLRPKRRSHLPTEFIPKATFWCADVISMIDHLPPISVLFYRCDTGGRLWHRIKRLRERGLPTDGVIGEGGSGLEIMGELLPLILKKFHPGGGWIFSDGSNADKRFRSIIKNPDEWRNRPSVGFKFKHEPENSFRNTARCRVMHAVRVLPIDPPSRRTQQNIY